MIKSTAAALLISATLGVAAVPAVAAVGVSIDIGVPPPPPRVEVVPEPRVGFYWVPGYWSWEGERHVWIAGRYVENRPGYYYVPERWEVRGERHHFEPGRWERGERR